MNEITNTQDTTMLDETKTSIKNNKIDISTAYTALIARIETVKIVVNVFNGILKVLQSRDPAVFTQEDLQKIQAVIDAETAKNEKLYEAIEKAMTKSSANVHPATSLPDDAAIDQ